MDPWGDHWPRQRDRKNFPFSIKWGQWKLHDLNFRLVRCIKASNGYQGSVKCTQAQAEQRLRQTGKIVPRVFVNIVPLDKACSHLPVNYAPSGVDELSTDTTTERGPAMWHARSFIKLHQIFFISLVVQNFKAFACHKISLQASKNEDSVCPGWNDLWLCDKLVGNFSENCSFPIIKAVLENIVPFFTSSGEEAMDIQVF